MRCKEPLGCDYEANLIVSDFVSDLYGHPVRIKLTYNGQLS